MEGRSTLGGLDIWYDDSVGRLNRDDRGTLLGNFQSDDKILVIYKTGEYELTSFELTNRYEPDKIMLIGKHDPEGVISVVHYDGAGKTHYVKRSRSKPPPWTSVFALSVKKRALAGDGDHGTATPDRSALYRKRLTR